MKKQFFALTITTAILALTSGCQTRSTDESKSASVATPPAPAPAPSAPAPAASKAPAQPKIQLPTLRINAGAGAIKDSTGVAWSAETGFVGGDVVERPELPIANTQQPEIYRSERFAMESFSQKLPNGKYQVKLHFCETFEGIGGPGERVFSFTVEGKAFKDFDVWAKSGGAARAYIETVAVDLTDGELNITFTPQVENPEINAIEIIPAM
jgi:hypothetical protein